MKVVVTGKGGQLASELESLKGFDPNWTFLSEQDLDITNKSSVSSYFQSNYFDILINCAAYTAVDKAEDEEELAFKVNAEGVKNLLEACEQMGAKLIHYSTDYVFDGSGELPVPEHNEVAPLGVYGASKLAGEEAIRAALTEHLILRTAWVFGVSGANFVKTMLGLAQTRNELGVVGDQYGAPTSARGIANAIATMVLQMSEAESTDDRWGTYHYTGNPFVSWARFAEEIFQQAEKKSMISSVPAVNAIGTEQYPTPAKRPANSRLDCSKIKDVFGIEPDDWRRSLGDVLDEIKGVG